MILKQAESLWEGWFASQGWQAFPFQRQSWDAYAQGLSGLISVATGSGKTYAAFGGPLLRTLTMPQVKGSELQVIFVSPLKALVRDLALALERPLQELKLPFSVEIRTGDSTPSERARMRKELPSVLVTTPESLALLLTEEGWQTRLSRLHSVVVDEWHELLGTKRGSLLELTLARLRAVKPLQTWALSATVGNLELAAQVAVGGGPYQLIQEKIDRPVEIHAILPKSVSAFPWFGFSGLHLAGEVLAQIDTRISTLVFTNTRSQAERWYQKLLSLKPEWNQILALHHGSLDRAERERVENGVKRGQLKVVVATSSLDLGVDFPQVEKVIQIGSAKGLSRALQRAGRAFHRPGEATALWVCPTHLLEVLEVSALREGLRQGALEARLPLPQPIDVLVQFALNLGFGDGFTKEELKAILKLAWSFKEVSNEALDWVLKLVTEGGRSLQAYPQFRKLAFSEGRYRFADERLARLHKLNMGTIVSPGGVQVQFARGARLGTIDEGFIARLRKGDVFYFSGRRLELLQMRDMKATVRLSEKGEGTTPIWTGTQFPITPNLSHFIRAEVERASKGSVASPELLAFQPAAKLQAQFSALPHLDEILIELFKSREGYHAFIYPFEGRAVHEGLGHLVALRLSRLRPNTISVSTNDFGFELLGTHPLSEGLEEALTETSSLAQDIEQAANLTELAKRAFREIARVAGLIQQGTEQKSVRQLQMSSSLLFDVFLRYDPDHLLLHQAFFEVRDRQLQLDRMERVMNEIRKKRFLIQSTSRLTPFSFPLFVERIRSRHSSEKLEDRIARLLKQLHED